MKLVFLGTRGEIEARTSRHRRHTSTEVSYRRRRVMVDAGRDWRDELDALRPDAIVLTHAHPDHAGGLTGGAPCPVYAPAETWQRLPDRRYPVRRREVEHRRPLEVVDGIAFEAFPVEHSIRALAVGYRVRAGKVAIFYAPDLVSIRDRSEALRECKLYVGDGATLTRPLVRRRDDHLIGHAPVRTQLDWCREEGVKRAIITHCGSRIVKGDERVLSARLRKMARERGLEARLAHDGMETILR